MPLLPEPETEVLNDRCGTLSDWTSVGNVVYEGAVGDTLVVNIESYIHDELMNYSKDYINMKENGIKTESFSILSNSCSFVARPSVIFE